MIDNAISVETSLSAELTLYPAGLAVRANAYLVDFAIKMSINGILAWLLSGVGDFGIGILLIVFFLIEWFYYVFWDVFNNGKPPGKIYLGIRTVHADGSPITLGGSVVRSLLLAVDLLPLFPFIGPISMATSRNFSRIGDLAAGTMVVYDANIPNQQPRRVHNRKSLTTPLSQEERQNFLAFQNRFEEFTKHRQIELSETLKPLIDASNQHAVYEVLGIAESIRRSS